MAVGGDSWRTGTAISGGVLLLAPCPPLIILLLPPALPQVMEKEARLREGMLQVR